MIPYSLLRINSYDLPRPADGVGGITRSVETTAVFYSVYAGEWTDETHTTETLPKDVRNDVYTPQTSAC